MPYIEDPDSGTSLAVRRYDMGQRIMISVKFTDSDGEKVTLALPINGDVARDFAATLWREAKAAKIESASWPA